MAVTVISSDSPQAVAEPKSSLAENENPKETPAPEKTQAKTASASGTEIPEEKEETTDDDSTAEADEQSQSDEDEGSEEAKAAEEKPENEKPKKKNGFKKRIDKLNSKLAQERQQREALERRVAELQAGGKKPATDSKEAPGADGKPKAEDFETQEEWIEALTDWKADQREKKSAQTKRQSELETEHQRVVTEHQKRVQTFAEKHEDFQEVMEDVEHINISPAVAELFVSSENGPELMYALAKDPEELERICKLSPLAAARAMGRIEARILSKSSDPKPEPKKITKAPSPIAPVGSQSKGQIAKSIHDPNLSQAEYERLRRKQMREAEAG